VTATSADTRMGANLTVVASGSGIGGNAASTSRSDGGGMGRMVGMHTRERITGGIVWVLKLPRGGNAYSEMHASGEDDTGSKMMVGTNTWEASKHHGRDSICVMKRIRHMGECIPDRACMRKS
jgi:hypothetical protein